MAWLISRSGREAATLPPCSPTTYGQVSSWFVPEITVYVIWKAVGVMPVRVLVILNEVWFEPFANENALLIVSVPSLFDTDSVPNILELVVYVPALLIAVKYTLPEQLITSVTPKAFTLYISIPPANSPEASGIVSIVTADPGVKSTVAPVIILGTNS